MNKSRRFRAFSLLDHSIWTWLIHFELAFWLYGFIFVLDNYIPNIDHRWYRTQPVVAHENLDVGPDKFYTNFRQVDENARVQDFLPANIIQVKSLKFG